MVVSVDRQRRWSREVEENIYQTATRLEADIPALTVDITVLDLVSCDSLFMVNLSVDCAKITTTSELTLREMPSIHQRQQTWSVSLLHILRLRKI